jgi:putrescine aminotransferase
VAWLLDKTNFALRIGQGQVTTPTELEALDRQYLLHPHQRTDRTDRTLIVRGKGCLVWDTEGNEYLDAMGGGNWAAQVGHGRPELAEVAAQQVGELEYFTSFTDFTNDKAVLLAERLVKLAPGNLGKVFFTNGGSESVETAIKAARLYHFRRGQEDRNWIIARHYGYHGTTLGSGTLTGFPPMQHGVGPVLPHVEKVMAPVPYHTELYGGQDVTDYLINELEETIARIGADKIAAMIGEPVIGGGGIYIPPDDYWPRVRAVLRNHGILLIADEIVTAFGRTGAWFDSAQRGIQPDIITTAKGITSGYIPLGAVLMTDEIAEILSGPESFFHGHTYFGHPVACAVALRNIDLIQDENLLLGSQKIGSWLSAALEPAGDLPFVGDVRVVGATVGIELVADKATKATLSHPFVENIVDEIRHAHGVIVRPYPNTIVLAPPLVLDEEQAFRAAGAIIDVLSRVRGDNDLAPR